MIQLKNEELAKYTSYKIGGKTPLLTIIRKKEDLIKIDLTDTYIFSGGTNILINDNNIDKNVVKIEINDSYIDVDNNRIYLGSGINLSKMAFFLCNIGISTFQGVFGIPGSIGGGLVMNCSASYGSISDNLISVECFDKNTKKFIEIKKEDCLFKFRHSIFKDRKELIIVGAYFEIKNDKTKNLLKNYNDAKKYRIKNYPTIFGSAGCLFKRDWGGKDIINKIEMTGKYCGNAVVSPLFPAFIINLGGATYTDIISLIKEIQDKAKNIGEDMPLEVEIWEK
jgi:UDP-N-acetylmuramate dehydrogenase